MAEEDKKDLPYDNFYSYLEFFEPEKRFQAMRESVIIPLQIRGLDKDTIQIVLEQLCQTSVVELTPLSKELLEQNLCRSYENDEVIIISSDESSDEESYEVVATPRKKISSRILSDDDDDEGSVRSCLSDDKEESLRHGSIEEVQSEVQSSNILETEIQVSIKVCGLENRKTNSITTENPTIFQPVPVQSCKSGTTLNTTTENPTIFQPVQVQSCKSDTLNTGITSSIEQTRACVTTYQNANNRKREKIIGEYVVDVPLCKQIKLNEMENTVLIPLNHSDKHYSMNSTIKKKTVNQSCDTELNAADCTQNRPAIKETSNKDSSRTKIKVPGILASEGTIHNFDKKKNNKILIPGVKTKLKNEQKKKRHISKKNDTVRNKQVGDHIDSVIEKVVKCSVGEMWNNLGMKSPTERSGNIIKSFPAVMAMDVELPSTNSHSVVKASPQKESVTDTNCNNLNILGVNCSAASMRPCSNSCSDRVTEDIIKSNDKIETSNTEQETSCKQKIRVVDISTLMENKNVFVENPTSLSNGQSISNQLPASRTNHTEGPVQVKFYSWLYKWFFDEKTVAYCAKLSEILHLVIADKCCKDGRLGRLTKGMSATSVAEEKRRIDREYSETLRIRGSEFKSLFNEILENSCKEYKEISESFHLSIYEEKLIYVLYCNIIRRLLHIERQNQKFSLSARNLICEMLKRNNYKNSVVYEVLNSTETSFKERILQIQNDSNLQLKFGENLDQQIIQPGQQTVKSNLQIEISQQESIVTKAQTVPISHGSVIRHGSFDPVITTANNQSVATSSVNSSHGVAHSQMQGPQQLINQARPPPYNYAHNLLQNNQNVARVTPNNVSSYTSSGCVSQEKVAEPQMNYKTSIYNCPQNNLQSPQYNVAPNRKLYEYYKQITRDQPSSHVQSGYKQLSPQTQRNICLNKTQASMSSQIQNGQEGRKQYAYWQTVQKELELSQNRQATEAPWNSQMQINQQTHIQNGYRQLSPESQQNVNKAAKQNPNNSQVHNQDRYIRKPQFGTSELQQNKTATQSLQYLNHQTHVQNVHNQYLQRQQFGIIQTVWKNACRTTQVNQKSSEQVANNYRRLSLETEQVQNNCKQLPQRTQQSRNSVTGQEPTNSLENQQHCKQINPYLHSSYKQPEDPSIIKGITQNQHLTGTPKNHGNIESLSQVRNQDSGSRQTAAVHDAREIRQLLLQSSINNQVQTPGHFVSNNQFDITRSVNPSASSAISYQGQPSMRPAVSRNDLSDSNRKTEIQTKATLENKKIDSHTKTMTNLSSQNQYGSTPTLRVAPSTINESSPLINQTQAFHQHNYTNRNQQTDQSIKNLLISKAPPKQSHVIPQQNDPPRVVHNTFAQNNLNSPTPNYLTNNSESRNSSNVINQNQINLRNMGETQGAAVVSAYEKNTSPYRQSKELENQVYVSSHQNQTHPAPATNHKSLETYDNSLFHRSNEASLMKNQFDETQPNKQDRVADNPDLNRIEPSTESVPRLIQMNAIKSFGICFSEDGEPQQACSLAECSSSAKVLCGGCRDAFYCSKKCQAYHWFGGHYGVCSFNEA